jgi:hypothetical protein
MNGNLNVVLVRHDDVRVVTNMSRLSFMINNMANTEIRR